MEYYLTVLGLLEQYFNSKNWRKLFLEGGCYWLANKLHEGIPGSYLMLNRWEEHCGICIEHGLYDVRGKIPSLNYKYATERDLNYMKKHYIPHFDVGSLEEYLRKEMGDDGRV